MAQTLDHNGAVINVTPLAVPQCDVDVTVIQQLDDEPNDVGGLSAAELKAKFDEEGANFKDYINNDLIPAIIASEATEEARELAEAERVANEQERVSNENTRIANENNRNKFTDYFAVVAYHPGNKVVYNGSSYLCIQDCTGIPPTNTGYWKLIAAKGDKGDTGNTGAQGQTGPQGATGNGIASIVKTGTSGLTDTYTITFTNGTTTTFTVTNGEDGQGAVDSVNGQTGTVVLDADDVGAVSYDQAQSLTDAQKSQAKTNLGAPQFVCNPNLLDNWYFGNPVNQRGMTTYGERPQYTIDRWKINDNWAYVDVNNGYITIRGNDVNGYGGISELLENQEELIGKNVTVSVLLKPYTSIVLMGKQICDGADNNFNLYTVSEEWKSGSYVDISAMSPVAVNTPIADIIAIKLELGTQQTLAHKENGVWVLNEIPDYGEQLAKCQRYYFDSRYGASENTKNAYVVVAHNISTWLVSNFKFPVPMRTAPSIIIYSISGTANKISFWTSNADVPNNSATANIVTIGVCGFNGVLMTSEVASNIYSFHIIANAEL